MGAVAPSPARLRRVGIVAHPRRDARPVLRRIAAWAREHELEVVGLKDECGPPPGAVGLVGEAALAEGSDLVVALGGDGTILRALRLAAPLAVPVLGVNLGRLGFLAEVEESEIAAALDAIARNEYAVERRLAVEVLGLPGREEPAVAYNDLVLSRQPGRGQAAVAVHVGGSLFARYLCDAVIAATPTGSTAYTFSAGGPIVSPRIDALLVTAVAPHATFNRALVVHPQERLELELLPQGAPVVAELDGVAVGGVSPGTRVGVQPSAHPGLVVRLNGGTSFYDRAREKLGVSDSQALGML